MLSESSGPLVAAHDLVALDLDGVVYIGNQAVEHAAEALLGVQEAGTAVAFVTNNASRTPEVVAEHLRELGIRAAATDVVTSAQAAARLLADRLPAGGRVWLLGGTGLEVALTEVGLTAVVDDPSGIDAVVQGYGPEMAWKRVISGAILVNEGRFWVACNRDRTMVTPAGVGPGNGALVDLVATFAGREPLVAGKPEKPLLEETQRRFAAQTPLFVGDRLDTDMAGANNVGWPSLLVRTGVTTLTDLVAARPGERPSYIARDLRGLHEPHPQPRQVEGAWVLGGWRATTESDGFLVVDGSGTDDDWWRCAASAAWAFVDNHQHPQGEAARVDRLRPPR